MKRSGVRKPNRYRCMRCGRGSKCKICLGNAQDRSICKKTWENGEGVIWEVMIWSEEWTRQGEVLMWCRKCSGYARQRVGPKLMNCCKLEQMGTRECGKK